MITLQYTLPSKFKKFNSLIEIPFITNNNNHTKQDVTDETPCINDNRVFYILHNILRCAIETPQLAFSSFDFVWGERVNVCVPASQVIDRRKEKCEVVKAARPLNVVPCSNNTYGQLLPADRHIAPAFPEPREKSVSISLPPLKNAWRRDEMRLFPKNEYYADLCGKTERNKEESSSAVREKKQKKDGEKKREGGEFESDRSKRKGGNRGGEEKKRNVDSTAMSSQVLTFFSIPSFFSFFFLSFVPWTNICILRGRNRTIATAELGRTGLWNLEISGRVFETLDAAVSTWDSNVETTRGTPVTRDIRPTGGYTAI